MISESIYETRIYVGRCAPDKLITCVSAMSILPSRKHFRSRYLAQKKSSLELDEAKSQKKEKSRNGLTRNVGKAWNVLVYFLRLTLTINFIT